MFKRIALSLVLCIAVGAAVNAQSVYLHPSHEVYDFLKRMDGKRILVDYRDAVKPMTRQDIAKCLIIIDARSSELTTVEKEELQFYKQEFYVELQQLKYTNEMPDERWHLYPYRSTPSTFNIDLIGGYSVEANPTKTNTKIRSNGLMGYGYTANSLGLYLYFRDNEETGTYTSARKDMTPDQGQITSASKGKTIQYDLADAQFNVDFSFLTLSIEKMPNVWGAGYQGNLILSDKPPSYPQLKLRAKLGKDVDFTFVHSWLSSDVIDSVDSYQVPGFVPTRTGYRTIYAQKYMAAQMLEASVANGVNISVGESEIYGGRNPELIYLLPVMFYFAAEHYNNDEDNKQVFGSVDVNALKNYDLYMTLFIDEFSPTQFYLTQSQRNQLGFTVGARRYDLLLPNSDFLIEYTRTNPWVYNHKYPDDTYQSSQFDLGDWIGQNADDLFLEANYRPYRNLKVGLQFESLRKGGKDSTKYQYLLPTPPFLYGPLIKRQAFGVTARYEIVRDMFVDCKVLLSRYTQGANIPGTFQYPRLSSDYDDRIDAFVAVRYNFY